MHLHCLNDLVSCAIVAVRRLGGESNILYISKLNSLIMFFLILKRAIALHVVSDSNIVAERCCAIHAI